MTTSPPPIYEKLGEDDGKPRLPWILFFNQVFEGDNGTSFTPSFQNLTIDGIPSITGKYFRSGRFIDFWVKIVPSVSTSATAGTTYIESMPFSIVTDNVCYAIVGTTGVAAGIMQASTNRIYVPSWTIVTSPITITGRAEGN